MDTDTILNVIKAKTAFDFDEIDLLWPPDVFAVTSTLLELSGAYRLVVSPPSSNTWPVENGEESWIKKVCRIAEIWRSACKTKHFDKKKIKPPEDISKRWEKIKKHKDEHYTILNDNNNWDTLCAVLELHVIADESCAGVGIPDEFSADYIDYDDYDEDDQIRFFLFSIFNDFLAKKGNLSHSSRVQVLPKMRTPQRGITLRSLSHHLAFNSGEVKIKWFWPSVKKESEKKEENKEEMLNILLIPFPYTVSPIDFKSIFTGSSPLSNMNTKEFGFFSYKPPEDNFKKNEIIALIEVAEKKIASIDIIIFPELAITSNQLDELRNILIEKNLFPVIIAGLRSDKDFEESQVIFDFREKNDTTENKQNRQSKHHRWYLDENQIQQYHLASALHPSKKWWEAIKIPERQLHCFAWKNWLSVCPLICEDLARQDPVANAIRAIGPTLVIAVLFDGPQLVFRWPALYASVLADDPGSTILTLTSYGMAQRSIPKNRMPSRIVGLWRDTITGTHEIELKHNKGGIVLTATVKWNTEWSADGRSDSNCAAVIILSAVNHIDFI